MRPFSAIYIGRLFSMQGNCWRWSTSLAIISRIRRPPVGSPVPGGGGGLRPGCGEVQLLKTCCTALRCTVKLHSCRKARQRRPVNSPSGSRVHPEPCIGSGFRETVWEETKLVEHSFIFIKTFEFLSRILGAHWPSWPHLSQEAPRRWPFHPSSFIHHSWLTKDAQSPSFTPFFLSL